jgi:hypothetical protein
MDNRPPDLTSQEALIRRYCAEAEERLLTATTMDDALRIRNELCARFEAECTSPMVHSATKQYITDVIIRTWNAHGHGSH